MLNSYYIEKGEVPKEPLDAIHDIIKCASCDKDLLRSVQITAIDKPMNYKFMCPHCGGKSFLQKFKFLVQFDPINCSLSDISLDEKENVWLVKLNQNKSN